MAVAIGDGGAGSGLRLWRAHGREWLSQGSIVMASGDGSNRGGSSGCENQGSRAAGSGCGSGRWCEQGRRRLWLRPLVARGSGETDAVKLRAAEAGTAMAQGSGVAEKQEAGRENMK